MQNDKYNLNEIENIRYSYFEKLKRIILINNKFFIEHISGKISIINRSVT